SIRKNINIHNPDIIEYRIRSMSFVSSRNYYSINRKFVIHTPKNKPNYTLRYPTKYELNKFKYCERNLHHNENIPPTSLYFINELGI
ncbi:MAG: hypothetical protein KDH96_13730, partial [Candidatus Riesia sp.]|nr:hypothetical protein [Candidatus Riesia sp.]